MIQPVTVWIHLRFPEPQKLDANSTQQPHTTTTLSPHLYIYTYLCYFQQPWKRNQSSPTDRESFFLPLLFQSLIVSQVGIASLGPKQQIQGFWPFCHCCVVHWPRESSAERWTSFYRSIKHAVCHTWCNQILVCNGMWPAYMTEQALNRIKLSVQLAFNFDVKIGTSWHTWPMCFLDCGVCGHWRHRCTTLGGCCLCLMGASENITKTYKDWSSQFFSKGQPEEKELKQELQRINLYFNSWYRTWSYRPFPFIEPT